MLDKARRDPRVQRVVEDVRMFDGLREHAGWVRLRRRFEEQIDKFERSITKRLFKGEVVSPEEIAFYMGYLAGGTDLLDTPEKAEENLERAARAAWAAVQTLRESQTNDQEASLHV